MADRSGVSTNNAASGNDDEEDNTLHTPQHAENERRASIVVVARRPVLCRWRGWRGEEADASNGAGEGIIRRLSAAACTKSRYISEPGSCGLYQIEVLPHLLVERSLSQSSSCFVWKDQVQLYSEQECCCWENQIGI